MLPVEYLALVSVLALNARTVTSFTWSHISHARFVRSLQNVHLVHAHVWPPDAHPGIVVCVARPVFVRLLNFAPFGSRNIASFCSGVILRDPLRRTSDMLSLRVSPLTGVMNACCDGGLWSACPTPVRAVVLPNRSWRESVWVNGVLTSVNNDIWFCSPDSSRWSRTVQ